MLASSSSELPDRKADLNNNDTEPMNLSLNITSLRLSLGPESRALTPTLTHTCRKWLRQDHQCRDLPLNVMPISELCREMACASLGIDAMYRLLPTQSGQDKISKLMSVRKSERQGSLVVRRHFCLLSRERPKLRSIRLPLGFSYFSTFLLAYEKINSYLIPPDSMHSALASHTTPSSTI